MSAVKEIVVVPKAAGREALGLLAAIGFILLLVGLRVVQVAPKNAEDGSKVYQMQDIKLKNQAPVLYRSLLGAADTITQLREESGNWPNIAALQQEDLPPFAAKFLPAGLNGFGWELHQGATWADYYGTNKNVAAAEKAGADPLENSFILRVIDLQAGKYPHPVAQQAKGQENRFSVQIWINPKTTDYPQEQPADKGWKWVVSGNTVVTEEKVN